MKHFNFFIVLSAFLLILNSSCEKSKIKQDIEALISTKISIPGYKYAVINGQSRYMPVDSSTIKLLVYYDSNTCGSCQVEHIKDWEKVISFAKDRKSFEPLFIFEPKREDQRELELILASSSFTGKVYIDKKNGFSSENPQIPDDTRFHVFLLDKNSHIVLVGNPLGSDMMWDLFRSTLDNMLAHDGIFVPES